MEWIGALHDRTNWCRLGVSWIKIDQMSSHSRRCSEREESIASLKGVVQISMPTSVTEPTNALSPGQYEDLSTNLPILKIGQETMALSFVPLLSSGTVVDHHSFAIQTRPFF